MLLLATTIISLLILTATAVPTSSPTAAPSDGTITTGQADSRADKIESYLQDLESNNRFMGTVSLSIDGNQVANTQVGGAIPSPVLLSNEETQYRVGSITEMFTSVMILQLVEEGKLNLDTKLASFFPSIPNAGTITIEHMLRHRSGIKNFTTDPIYQSYRTIPQTRNLMLLRIEKEEPDFNPGAKAEYSNSNYLLLGYIIEDITGNSYEDELVTRIADPLGLTRTAYFTEASATDNVAFSFSWQDGDWMRLDETDPSVPGGAGAIMSTASELTLFVESLFAGQLINESSLASMTEMVDGFGLGIFPKPFKSNEGFGHTGGIDGFRSYLAYFPKDKIALAWIGNGHHNLNLDTVTNTLLSITFMEDFQVSRSATINRQSASIWRMMWIPLAVASLLSLDDTWWLI